MSCNKQRFVKSYGWFLTIEDKEIMRGTRTTKIGEAFGRYGTNEWLRNVGGDARGSRLLSLLLAFIVLLFAVPPGPAWGQTTAAERESSGEEMPTLGATEQVVLVNEENGEEVEALARIDSGAFYTSIGQDLADEIGLDTENAETITARSTLGEETRPLLEITMRIAGQERNVRVTVTDRSDVGDPMLIGRQDLTGFTIDTSQEQLTTPSTSTREPPVLALLDFPAPPPNPASLLAALPVAVLVVVVFRVLIGLQTFGVFAPVLLALAFVQVGLPAGLLVFGAMLLAGLIIEPLLRPLKLPRVARLAVILAIVAGVLLALGLFGPDPSASRNWTAAFPVVIISAVIEQFWGSWEQEGIRPALISTLWTTLAALVAAPLLVIKPVAWLAEHPPYYPFVLVIAGVGLSILVGLYRGLRLSEFIRFRPAISKDKA